MDFNAYHDTRDFQNLTINLLANLPNKIQYFSLNNFQSANNKKDLDHFYSEHNVRLGIGKYSPFQLTYQAVIQAGENNDQNRLGFRLILGNSSRFKSFFKKHGLFYSINPFFIQISPTGKTQLFPSIEHVYRVFPFNKKGNKTFYIAGFADHNISSNEGKLESNWVTEHQAGYAILPGLYAIVEYRLNTYLPSKQNGMGLGIEYKISF